MAQSIGKCLKLANVHFLMEVWQRSARSVLQSTKMHSTCITNECCYGKQLRGIISSDNVSVNLSQHP